jgi:hypothetical protein
MLKIPENLSPIYKRTIWLALGAFALVVLSKYFINDFLPAFRPSSSDFSELYATSWAWRHGQNPYNSALATAARQRVVGASGEIFLVHVPTALVLVSPLTFLSWVWAHLLFLILGAAGLVATTISILRLQGRSSWGLGTASLIVFLITFSPLRIAFEWGNIVLMALPLSLLAIVLAKSSRDVQAGLLVGITTCLKPQIGIWFVLYYLLRGRFRILFSSLAIGFFLTGLFFVFCPVPYAHLIADYRSNLHHWFAPGGLYSFTEGSEPEYLLRAQGIFYRISHQVFLSSFMSYVLFLSGLAVWANLVWHSGERVPSSLAIAALLALSFVSFYHSIPDLSVLTISLCEAFPASFRNWKKTQKLTCALLLLMMLPERSIFVFLRGHLNSVTTSSWWWDLFVVRFLVWLLLALSLALLLQMYEESSEKRRFPSTDPQALPTFKFE